MDRKEACVPLSLKGFLHDVPAKRWIVNLIDEAANGLANIRTSAAELRLLHVTRCLEQGIDLGNDFLNNNLFNRSYYAVSLAVQGAQNGWQTQDPGLAQSGHLFWQQRPAGQLPPERSGWLTPVLQPDAQQARTNAKNHVRFNFGRYLERWVRGCIAVRVDDLMWAQGGAVPGQPGPLTWYTTPHPVHTPRKLENAVAKAVIDAIRFKNPQVQQPFQQKLDGLPNNAHLRRHPLPAAEVHWLEAQVAWARNMIGMDMLPATDEQLALQPGRFLRVLHAMLHDIHVQRLMGIGKSRPFTLLPLCSIQAPFLQLHAQAFHRLLLEADARMVNNGLQGIVGPNGEPLPAWAEFNADRQYWMDHFLRVSKVTRTADTQFTYKQWLSDGHSVRAVVTRPGGPPPADVPAGGGHFVTGGAVPPFSKSTRVVGIDPGQKSVIMGAVTTMGELSWLQNCLNSPIMQRVERVHWSSGRWHEQAGHNWHERRAKRMWALSPQLEMNKRLTPTPKVPSVDLLLQHISHRLLLLPEIIDFANRHSAKDLRWKAFKRGQAALTALCLSVTNGDPDTIVAYGAASFDHAHHGNRSGPTKKVLQRLKSMARVYLVDEYLTSQLCADCHHRMRNAALEYGPWLPNRPRPRKWSIKLCEHFWCWRNLWNRDFNAALNVLFLLHQWITGQARPAYFRPGGGQAADPDAMDWEALLDLQLMQAQGYV